MWSTQALRILRMKEPRWCNSQAMVTAGGINGRRWTSLLENQARAVARARNAIVDLVQVQETRYNPLGLPRMWSTIQKSFQTFFSYDSNFEFIVGTADAVAETSTATVTTNRPTPDSIITGPPRLPPEIEVQIFEDCARNNRETCLELILVARRVRVWYVLGQL